MITSKLQQAVNDQITAELWSSNLYLQMSYYLKHLGWDGFAHWMKCHSDEEREHATRMGDYLTDRGGQVKLKMVNLVPEGWGSVVEVFEHSLSQEKMVSKMIDKIVLHAIEEQDFATENFFRTFVDEQVEEEALFEGIVDKLRMAGDSGLAFMDAQLGRRRE
ncbi:MAG: ferritin [Bacteroidales bacterium]|jgi:ferritin|nr:ferritin [Bacteroidales bacterium]